MRKFRDCNHWGKPIELQVSPMGRVGSYSAKDIMRVLREIGFVLKGIRGSHYMYYDPRTGKKISVPFHAGDVPRGIAHRIFKNAGLSYDTLREL